MLMGEHAVLRGYPSLVAAIDKRIKVTAIPRTDRNIHIISALGEATWSLDALPVFDPKFNFMLAAIQALPEPLKQGYDLRVDADFSDQMGLGSSAAVVVGTLAVLNQANTHQRILPKNLLTLSCGVIQRVQGFGSGADAAASILGGVVLHHPEQKTEVIANTLPWVVVYSGSKEKTTQVVKKVNARVSAQPQQMGLIFEAMQQGVLKATAAIQAQDWGRMGQVMNAQQGLMQDLGVSNTTLETLIGTLRAAPGILGAKISGSGLGDCVVALGSLLAANALPLTMPQQYVDAPISAEGILYGV
jgi:mevalonate kinase